MTLSRFNLLGATLLLALLIASAAALRVQHQKVTVASEDYQQSLAIEKTLQQLVTSSAVWFEIQEIFFSEKTLPLAKVVLKQSERITLLVTYIKKRTGNDSAMEPRLLLLIKKQTALIGSIDELTKTDTRLWLQAQNDFKLLSQGYHNSLSSLVSSCAKAQLDVVEKLDKRAKQFIMLSYTLIFLHVLLILFLVKRFTQLIVKPIEKMLYLTERHRPYQQAALSLKQLYTPPVELLELLGIIQADVKQTSKTSKNTVHDNVNTPKDMAMALMDYMPASVLLVDEQGLIQACNSETEQLLRANKIALLQQRVTDFLPALSTLEGTFDCDAVLKRMEESLLTPCYANPHIEYSGHLIEFNRCRFYLLIVSDINERKNIQREVSALNEQLVHAEKLASIGELSAGMTHEINNPIGFIQSNTKVLSDYCHSLATYINLAHQGDQSAAESLYKKEDLAFVLSDIKPLISSILEGTARISKIIKDLGHYAHVDNKLPEVIVVDSLIEKSLTLVTNELKYKVEVSCQLNAKTEVSGFPHKLLQVFINILVNASHAIETKGKVFIITQVKAQEVIISFEDTGSGITQKDLKNIFEPFYTTKPVGKGTGLGLYIVKTIIEEHGGHIEVTSNIGQGSQFVIYLPVYQEEFEDPVIDVNITMP